MENFFKGCLGCFGLIILFSLIIGGCTAFFSSDEDNENPEPTTTDETSIDQSQNAEQEQTKPAVAKQPENKKGSWKEKIQQVAASEKTETEKFDEVSLYAQDYVPSRNELVEFENYIVGEYTNQKYLADITNAEYMLTNIFKAEVVDTYYDKRGQGNIPIALFAFDFWQNTKYTYRGVDDVNSQEVKANERQMNKALANMQ